MRKSASATWQDRSLVNTKSVVIYKHWCRICQTFVLSSHWGLGYNNMFLPGTAPTPSLQRLLWLYICTVLTNVLLKCKTNICETIYGSNCQGLFSTNKHSQITRFTWPTWGPPGSFRPQVGPMLAPWALLSGLKYMLCTFIISPQQEQPREPQVRVLHAQLFLINYLRAFSVGMPLHMYICQQ